MPRLTVRALAEMLPLPAYQQARILSEQKYPKQEPQVFRTPYYSPALTGIRSYYRGGRDPSQIQSALGAVQSIALESKRINNRRVLEAFQKHDMRQRKLSLQPNIKVVANAGSVELKLSPDLKAAEGDDVRFFFLNCRAAKLVPEIATLTAEIAHWVLEQNSVKIPISRIEYVDLFTGETYSTSNRRGSTTKAIAQNVKIIETLWPTL